MDRILRRPASDVLISKLNYERLLRNSCQPTEATRLADVRTTWERPVVSIRLFTAAFLSFTRLFLSELWEGVARFATGGGTCKFFSLTRWNVELVLAYRVSQIRRIAVISRKLIRLPLDVWKIYNNRNNETFHFRQMGWNFDVNKTFHISFGIEICLLRITFSNFFFNKTLRCSRRNM